MPRTSINIITAFLLLTFCYYSIAEASGEPSVMASLRRNYGGVRAVNASFELTTYWDVREREERRSGELNIAPGDKFRVSLGRDVFVSDGRTFWQFSERNAQVVVRNFSDIDPASLPSGMLASFLSGREFRESRRDGGAVEIQWSGNDGEYREITVDIEERSGIIRTLRMVDVNNNIHTYLFRNTVFDRPPRNDTFQFRAPRGVEVLDMRDGR